MKKQLKKNPQQLNEELIRSNNIEGTPFQMVKANDKYFLALGKYRLSPFLNTEEEVIQETKDASWNRILSVILACIHAEFDMREELTKMKSIHKGT